ncbi:MAG: hypothetical protein IJ865_01270, partial [Clostridia bacterium]|nr:hypothetical protein [Clostridia bacterium]
QLIEHKPQIFPCPPLQAVPAPWRRLGETLGEDNAAPERKRKHNGKLRQNIARKGRGKFNHFEFSSTERSSGPKGPGFESRHFDRKKPWNILFQGFLHSSMKHVCMLAGRCLRPGSGVAETDGFPVHGVVMRPMAYPDFFPF